MPEYSLAKKILTLRRLQDICGAMEAVDMQFKQMYGTKEEVNRLKEL